MVVVFLETMAPLPVQITLVAIQMAHTVSGVLGHPVEELWQLHSTRSALMILETAWTTIWNFMMVQMPAHHLLDRTVERYGMELFCKVFLCLLLTVCPIQTYTALCYCIISLKCTLFFPFCVGDKYSSIQSQLPPCLHRIPCPVCCVAVWIQAHME